MLKKLLIVTSIIALVSSCKKDDWGGTNIIPSPQITSTAFIGNHIPGAKFNNYRLDSGIIKIPTAGGVSIAFDYTGVPNGTPWSDTLKSPTNLVDYPTASYATGLSDSLFGQKLTIQRYYKLNATTWSVLGDDYDALTISAAGTGSASIPKQAVKKNPSQILAQFPINYGDSMQQTCTSALNFIATIPPTPPLPTSTTGPITITQEIIVNSKNICWGTLRIKGYTDTMQVVVQKYTTTIKNTFSSTNLILSFAIPSILNNFNVTNGQSVTLTSYRFWAANKGLVMTINGDGSANVTTGL